METVFFYIYKKYLHYFSTLNSSCFHRVKSLSHYVQQELNLIQDWNFIAFYLWIALHGIITVWRLHHSAVSERTYTVCWRSAASYIFTTRICSYTSSETLGLSSYKLFVSKFQQQSYMFLAKVRIQKKTGVNYIKWKHCFFIRNSMEKKTRGFSWKIDYKPVQLKYS